MIYGDLKEIEELFSELAAEIERQDMKHGPFRGTSDLGKTRLALACLEDEVREALDAWREERREYGWDETRREILQVAAVAIRALRDAFERRGREPEPPGQYLGASTVEVDQMRDGPSAPSPESLGLEL